MDVVEKRVLDVVSVPPVAPVCLVAEDEAFLATLLEVEFAEAGFEVAGPFKRVADALDWLQHNTPDIAVIDTLLADGSSSFLAQALKRRAVPFIVHSGSDPRPQGPDEAFSGAPWLTKPIQTRDVIEATRRHLTPA